MAQYIPEEDEILWESEPLQHKAKAVLQAVVKRYKKGPAKLLITEIGEGYGGKRYGSTFLKRVDLQDLKYILELLEDGKGHLESITAIIEKEKSDAMPIVLSELEQL